MWTQWITGIIVVALITLALGYVALHFVEFAQEPISLKRFRRFLENFWPIFDPDSRGNMLYADMAPRIGTEKWLKKSQKSTETF